MRHGSAVRAGPWACAIVCLILCVSSVRGQNLLVNGDLDDPGIHESDVITGWTLTEGPAAVNAATPALLAV